MERAREELRDVTLAIATTTTAEAKYIELISKRQIDCTLPEYMESLQNKKLALQEEVLNYLGLRWTAPLRDWESPPFAGSRRSSESLQPETRRSGELWVREDEGSHAWQSSAFVEQDAEDGQMPLPPFEDTFGALRDQDYEDARARGISVAAEVRSPGGDSAVASLDRPVESAHGALHPSVQEPSTSQWRPASPETRAPARVNPCRADNFSVVKRIPSSLQGPGITSSVRFRSPVATRQLQQPQLPPITAVVSVASSPSPIAPFILYDGSDDAECPGECTLPTVVQLTTRTSEGGGSDSRNYRWCSLEPRIVPEDSNSRRLGWASATPAFAHRLSLENTIATSPHFSESDLGSEETRGPTRCAGGDRAADAVEGDIGLTLRGPSLVLGPQRTEGAHKISRPPFAYAVVRPAGEAHVDEVTGRADRSSSRAQKVSSRGPQSCRNAGCHRRPIYAFRGDTKALCCPLHRSEEMVNVRHPLCRHDSCFRQPSFGMEGDKRARYCSEHKHPAMINVSSRRCQASGCLRHPNFGFQGDRRASYCCRHKAPGMVDVVSRRCKFLGCMRRPLYAMTGQHTVFCRIHKEPGMTDVVSRRCDYEGGCDRHPSFGWKRGDGKARRCARHRLEGMESVKVNRRVSADAK